MNFQAHVLELKGSSYEVGKRQGRLYKELSMLDHHENLKGLKPFTANEVKEADKMLGYWCPGMDEELTGFSEETGIDKAKLTFYAMSCLQPRCSQIGLNWERMEDGKSLLARNYDFNPTAEDFTLVRTKIKGKYTHLATSTMTFGRDEGINEHGLSITMSSCGIPVGALKYMQAPRTNGLVFWIVIRSLLENCCNLNEAISMVKKMPIAYNMNMIVMDANGDAALIESVDDQKVVLKMENGTLYATNHGLSQAFKSNKVMRNSVERENAILRFFKSPKVLETDVKDLLLTPVDEGGLCNPYYEDFLGTTKSIILRPMERTLEICWGGLKENGWQKYFIDQTLEEGHQKILLKGQKALPEVFEFVSK